MSGSPRSAVTSLMIEAPLARASSATRALDVSIERGTAISDPKSSSTGKSLRSSSSRGTGSEPGRVDSAPRSSRSASCWIRPRACSAAAESERPPSEKLSGVMLTIPMTPGIGLPAARMVRSRASHRVIRASSKLILPGNRNSAKHSHSHSPQSAMPGVDRRWAYAWCHFRSASVYHGCSIISTI